MKEVHSRIQYMEERKRLGEYKGSGGRVQREAKYRSKKIREVINNRKKILERESYWRSM